MLQRKTYLSDFSRFWSDRPELHKIWFSIYTPQEGDLSEERLQAEDRKMLFDQLTATAAEFSKVDLPRIVLDGYRNPPRSPQECTLARLSTCISADLKTRVGPCQFGGKPVCAECGCMASAGMHAVSRIKLGGLVPLSAILDASTRLGRRNAAA